MKVRRVTMQQAGDDIALAEQQRRGISPGLYATVITGQGEKIDIYVVFAEDGETQEDLVRFCQRHMVPGARDQGSEEG